MDKKIDMLYQAGLLAPRQHDVIEEEEEVDTSLVGLVVWRGLLIAHARDAHRLSTPKMENPKNLPARLIFARKPSSRSHKLWTSMKRKRRKTYKYWEELMAAVI